MSDLLEVLNDARKDVQYGEAGSQLREIDLETLVSDLEQFIDEVEAMIQAFEEG